MRRLGVGAQHLLQRLLLGAVPGHISAMVLGAPQLGARRRGAQRQAPSRVVHEQAVRHILRRRQLQRWILQAVADHLRQLCASSTSRQRCTERNAWHQSTHLRGAWWPSARGRPGHRCGRAHRGAPWQLVPAPAASPPQPAARAARLQPPAPRAAGRAQPAPQQQPTQPPAPPAAAAARLHGSALRPSRRRASRQPHPAA